MPHDIAAILIGQSRRLFSSIVNIGDTVCCKRWKRKTTECQPQSDELDEVKEVLDSSVPDIVADITNAEATSSENTVEPDWVKRFFEVKVIEENCDEIFQSDDEEDEDLNDWVKEPCPLPFENTEVEDLYETRPEKNNNNQESGNPRFWKYLTKGPPTTRISSQTSQEE